MVALVSDGYSCEEVFISIISNVSVVCVSIYESAVWIFFSLNNMMFIIIVVVVVS